MRSSILRSRTRRCRAGGPACKQGNHAVLQPRASDLEYALTQAVVAGNTRAVEALIGQGARVSYAAADHAGRRATPDMVDLLFKQGAPALFLDVALSSSALCGGLATVERLLSLGGNPLASEETAYIRAAAHGRLDVQERLQAMAKMSPRTRDHVLVLAAERGDISLVEWAIRLKPDLDTDDCAPMRAAIKLGNARMVETLLRAGAVAVSYPDTQAEHEKRIAFPHHPEDQQEFNAEIAALFRAQRAKNSPYARPPVHRRLP